MDMIIEIKDQFYVLFIDSISYRIWIIISNRGLNNAGVPILCGFLFKMYASCCAYFIHSDFVFEFPFCKILNPNVYYTLIVLSECSSFQITT